MSISAFVVFIGIICIFGFFNEKVTKMPYEISLMVFSIILGIGILVFTSVFNGADASDQAEFLDIESFLLDGVLCFMLFASSCRMKLADFKSQARQVIVLAFGCTLLGSLIYGFLMFGAAKVFAFGISLPICLMYGSIIAPTDPIAATGILSRFGLPKKISFLIESESLFNDGVGVALFVFFSGMVTSSSSESFILIMLKEIFGAVLVGIVVTALCFLMFRFSKNKALRIFISLLAVSLSYAICEKCGFSGAIASVICGIMFSALRSRFSIEEPEEAKGFDSFWETLDSLCNSSLYVLLGLSFVRIMRIEYVILLALVAITANLIARVSSLSISTLIMGKIPNGYDRWNFIKLLTWGGLRGGLSVALAMSTKEMLPEDIYYVILGGTYAVVFFTTVVQGLTMKSVYKRIDRSVKRKNAAG